MKKLKKIIYKEILKSLKELEKKVKADGCFATELIEIKKYTKILVLISGKTTPLEVPVLRHINNKKDGDKIFLDKEFNNIKNYFFVLGYLDFLIKNPIFYNLLPQFKKFNSFIEGVITDGVDNLDEALTNLDL